MKKLEIRNDSFYLDEKPVRLLSAAMHYFRTPPEYWRDRLLKLKAAGFNTIETYVAWNLHQPENKPEYDFSGMLDLDAFLRLVQELGMYALVRPGPYICSEWDNGALPWWLLADENLRLRCMDPNYISFVNQWFDELLPRLVSLQSTKNGPILAMQVENEYGSYGNDHEYLNWVREKMISAGVDVPLYTSDGPTDWMLEGGTIESTFKTANFGSHAKESFNKLREHQKIGPMMCMEYWNGWFDHWGEEHHTRDAQDAASVLEEMLKYGASVNVYMGHGGTNFGYMAGANSEKGIYQPTVSSYDDDALLNEAGGITPKYEAFKKVIGKYMPQPDMELPAPAPVLPAQTVAMEEYAPIALPLPVHTAYPECMEKVGQGYGYILYRTFIGGPREALPLNIIGVHDRAKVWLNDRYLGEITRNDEKPIEIGAIGSEGATLSILVMTYGRINYGPQMPDRKGIVGQVRHGQQFLYHWDIYRLPFTDRSNLIWTKEKPEAPCFSRGSFAAEALCDTFLMTNGIRGEVWVNGHHLGRFDKIGPQQTLYVPAPWLKKGKNLVEVFDFDGINTAVELLEQPVLDKNQTK